jgi:hypothetical protein
MLLHESFVTVDQKLIFVSSYLGLDQSISDLYATSEVVISKTLHIIRSLVDGRV